MDLAIVGLGIMGRSLALNFERHGFSVAGYDLNPGLDRTSFMGRNITVFPTLAKLAESLSLPRRILLLVPAGAAVEDVLSGLRPHLAEGDILIDGGNSFFQDTERRQRKLEIDRIFHIGMGISGGETGALQGPSLMAGGNRTAWEQAAPLFREVAARAEDGTACVAYIGEGGSGHYVKMVHNSLEYADMQLIAEIYDLLRRGCGMTPAEIAEVFAEWNKGELRSYLVEITSKILRRTDSETGKPMVDVILDVTGQKGTGKWVAQNALDLGMPISVLSMAVDSRFLSAMSAERMRASASLTGPAGMALDAKTILPAARAALYAGKIAAYAQGFAMLRSASAEYGYGLDLAAVASVWRAGCIIRASILEDLATAYRKDPALENLLLDAKFRAAMDGNNAGWRAAVSAMIAAGIPAAALGAALAYYDAYRSERLPASLLQAQRDFFGAHGYERTDRPGTFHTVWETEISPGAQQPTGDATGEDTV